MMKILELREIIRMISKSTIQEFNLKNKGVRISIKKPMTDATRQTEKKKHQAIIQSTHNEAAVTIDSVYPESKPVRPKFEVDENKPEYHKVISTVIGVFSSSPESGTEPFGKVGNRITAGTVLGRCKVELLNLEHGIISDISGEIVEVLVDEGEIVEYGQPLFLVRVE